MERSIKVGNKMVGTGHPVCVIAEAGVNHNGDPDLAFKLLESARNAGADCVKFQTFKAESVVSQAAPKAAYQLKTTDPSESQLDMLRRLELEETVYVDLLAQAKEWGIQLLSTPYNIEDVDFLDRLGIPAFKLASMHVAEPYFIDYVARKGKPVFLSTGMATMEEVGRAVSVMENAGNDQLVLLQCTTNYPSAISDTNLRAMVAMGDVFDCLIGYSDHTIGDTACIGAVALGACVIEKHFTLDQNMEGPDHATSVDPEGFSQLIKHINEAQSMLGSGLKFLPKWKKITPSVCAGVYIPGGPFRKVNDNA